MPVDTGSPISETNIEGGSLINCCLNPLTGFYRNGKCSASEMDMGAHVVCAELNTDFLEYSKSRGNNLMEPNPMFGFPGLKEGDRWCLCALRWKEAYDAGKAPQIDLKASERKCLDFIDYDVLKQYSID